MRFLIQQTQLNDPSLRRVANTLQHQFKDLEFASPNELMRTLREHFTLNSLDFGVNQTSGVVNVLTDAGILLRFRSPN